MSESSPEFTITFHEGAYDVLKECAAKVGNTHPSATADSYETLARALRVELELSNNLLGNLVRLLQGTSYDGPLHLSPDTAPLSLFFRYEKSGYHGAMIFHPDSNGDTGRWSIHT